MSYFIWWDFKVLSQGYWITSSLEGRNKFWHFQSHYLSFIFSETHQKLKKQPQQLLSHTPTQQRSWVFITKRHFWTFTVNIFKSIPCDTCGVITVEFKLFTHVRILQTSFTVWMQSVCVCVCVLYISICVQSHVLSAVSRKLIINGMNSQAGI